MKPNQQFIIVFMPNNKTNKQTGFGAKIQTNILKNNKIQNVMKFFK